MSRRTISKVPANGTRVKHPTLGRGTVMDYDEPHGTLTVLFDAEPGGEPSTKMLLWAFCSGKLQLVKDGK